jgi:Holliday junction resolvase RusA-like endonuclease
MELMTKTYIIPVKPVGWKRAGVSFQNQNFYDSQLLMKNSIGFFIEQQHGDDRPFHHGPIRADREYWFPMPKSLNKRPKWSQPWMITVPDIDNLDAFVYDTLVKQGILPDDRYICSGSESKKYAKEPKIIITLTELS